MKTTRLTTIKIQTGIFDVQWDGKPTAYRIENGSIGLSGRDTANTYMIVNHSKMSFKPIGPLNTCKALLEMKFLKAEKEGRA